MRTSPRKTFITPAICLIIIALTGCKKNDPAVQTPVPSSVYATLNDFFAANEVKSQTVTIDAGTGGSFTTAQGTQVVIQPNSFVDQYNHQVSGPLKVEFKDIYKKSDMLLSDIPTTMFTGGLLKSAGEFFIRVQKDTSVRLSVKKAIIIKQPANNKVVDTSMKPFVREIDGSFTGWVPANDTISRDTLAFQPTQYVFSLYNYNSFPVSSGTWCNSDNPSYFYGYKQTAMTITPDFVPSDYDADVYLVFKGINAMVHVYQDANGHFPYNYAPFGLQCTVVVVGMKNSKLYASFTDDTISTNQSIPVSFTEMSPDDFKTKLKSLDD